MIDIYVSSVTPTATTTPKYSRATAEALAQSVEQMKKELSELEQKREQLKHEHVRRMYAGRRRAKNG